MFNIGKCMEFKTYKVNTQFPPLFLNAKIKNYVENFNVKKTVIFLEYNTYHYMPNEPKTIRKNEFQDIIFLTCVI